MNKTLQYALKLSNDLHLPRRVWHMATGTLGLIYYYAAGLTPDKMSDLLLTMGAVVFLLETFRLRNRTFNQFVLRVMGPLMREKERKRYSGFVFYAFGVALTLRFFHENIAILSSMFLIFGDPLSSMAGIHYGKKELWQGKTIVGSLAGVAVCVLLTILYGSVYAPFSLNLILFAIIAGFIGSAAELCTFYVDDNFVIPIFSGLGVTLLNTQIPIFQ